MEMGNVIHDGGGARMTDPAGVIASRAYYYKLILCSFLRDSDTARRRLEYTPVSRG